MILSRFSQPLFRRDSDPNASYQGHSSDEIANAIAQHAQRMSVLNKDMTALPASPASYQGHDSSDIAQAIRDYIAQHQDQPWPETLSASTTSSSPSSSSSNTATSFRSDAMLASSASSFLQYDTVETGSPVYSLAAHIQAHQWMQIIFCIVWIALGLVLVFFGWSSYFWGASWVSKPTRIDEKASKNKKRSFLLSGPPLAGGLGGLLVGFLFFSFLSTVVAAAICVSESRTLSPTSYFVVWLLSGLLGALLGCHWAFLARAFTGLLAGACSTLIVTAMFGIHTLIIRAIFISVFTTLITAPLLIPKRNGIHFHVLNLCTSIIGIVTLLDGVALYTPPQASSTAWIDLWVLLFAADNSSSQLSATKKWGSSAFKGYIAGAVLGAVVGYLFEFILHKHASEDPDLEWNKYLGSYTQRLEKDEFADINNRAGSFEPAPSAWQKMSKLFAASNRPAAYGDVPANEQTARSPLTNMPGKKGRRAYRARSRTSKGGPAKFEALSNRNRDLEEGDSDSDATEYDSDSSLQNPKSGHKLISTKSVLSKSDVDVGEDRLGLLHTSDDSKLENYRGYALPRLPSYRSNTSNNKGGSGMSGATAVSNGSGLSDARSKDALWKGEKSNPPHREDGPVSPTIARPSALSRQTTMSPPPSFSSSVEKGSSTVAASVPATPSLVNAITRIQAAQAQAKAWYEARQNDVKDTSEASPYGPQSSGSPVTPVRKMSAIPEDVSSVASKSRIEDDAKTIASRSTQSREAATSSAPKEEPRFDSWWSKEVKGKK